MLNSTLINIITTCCSKKQFSIQSKVVKTLKYHYHKQWESCGDVYNMTEPLIFKQAMQTNVGRVLGVWECILFQNKFLSKTQQPSRYAVTLLKSSFSKYVPNTESVFSPLE